MSRKTRLQINTTKSKLLVLEKRASQQSITGDTNTVECVPDLSNSEEQ